MQVQLTEVKCHFSTGCFCQCAIETVGDVTDWLITAKYEEVVKYGMLHIAYYSCSAFKCKKNAYLALN